MDTHDPVRFLQHEVSRLSEENRELKDELTVLRSSVRALCALQDIIHRLTPSSDVLVLLDDLLASALAVVGASDGSLLLMDEETGELVFAVVHGEARDRLTGHRLPKDQGIAGWVAQNQKALIIDNVREDPRFYAEIDEAFGFRTRGVACVPLVDDDRVLGVIEAVNKTYDRDFTREDHDLLMIVGHLATIALRTAESYAESGSG